MTTCSCTDKPTLWPREQTDWLTGTVTVNVTIDTQPVSVSIDSGTTFLDAEWTGSAGTTRGWQARVIPADVPAGLTYQVVVKVHDTSGPDPVDVLLDAGTITFV